MSEWISVLEKEYPHYKIIIRGRNEILVYASREYGMLITIRKRHIHVGIEFTTWYSKSLYYLSFFVFGLFISLGIFYSFFFSRERRMKKELVNFIKTPPV